ncbi:hypothetical protein [uncultured Marinobacter sp.]|uniref:hypothetical protein n=1 Tax=uncultured Marinobacter sp. TaxID=187379 RepID=UPI0030D83CC8
MQYSETNWFPGIRFTTIRVSQLSAIPDIEPSALEVLMAPIPAMREKNAFTPSLVQLAAILHMPVVWQPEAGQKTYRVLANLRTAEVCRHQLAPGERIAVLVVSALPTHISVGELIALAGFVSSIWHGLDAVSSRNLLNQQATLIHPSTMARYLPELSTKSGRERLLGQNRRYQIPERAQVQSPTSQDSLALALEDCDD